MKRFLIFSSIVILGLIVAIYWQYRSSSITPPLNEEEVLETELLQRQKYINNKFAYSLDYPESWTFREFPETKTGAGFRPLDSLDEIASECINVNAQEMIKDIPFIEYVKEAAIIEIQNFERLNSIKTVITPEGLVGYETTWLYKDLSGEEKISLPITYFENKGNANYPRQLVQIILNQQDCQEVYDEMVLTFKSVSIEVKEEVDGDKEYDEVEEVEIIEEETEEVKN